MGIKKNLKSIGAGVSKVIDFPYEGAKKLTKKVAKSERVGPFKKAAEFQGETERFENFYTGKKINPLWAGGASLAYLGASYTKSSFEHDVTMPMNLATKNAVHYGSPDIMMYDGVGQERAPKNLNAEGSLVMGLHNMRKG